MCRYTCMTWQSGISTWRDAGGCNHINIYQLIVSSALFAIKIVDNIIITIWMLNLPLASPLQTSDSEKNRTSGKHQVQLNIVQSILTRAKYFDLSTKLIQIINLG